MSRQTTVSADMASMWTKMEGGKFLLKHVSERGDEFIKNIAKFEAKIDDVGNFTADILLKSGKKLECKSWKQKTFNTRINEPQFKNQLKNYIKDGDFE
jgi:hypothetical protein